MKLKERKEIEKFLVQEALKVLPDIKLKNEQRKNYNKNKFRTPCILGRDGVFDFIDHRPNDGYYLIYEIGNQTQDIITGKIKGTAKSYEVKIG